MIVDLRGIENQALRNYIKEEGHYTLKCVEVKHLRTSENGNPVYRFSFVNKHDEYFNDDITITDNTKWKIKQLSTAFGFTYDKVNIEHFVGMYLVAWLVSKKVRNKFGDVVEILEAKQYTKSTKLTNDIPAEGSYIEPTIVYEKTTDNIKIDEDEIPF